MVDAETIAAIATPPGRGGVGVVRVSGFLSSTIAEHFLGRKPKPRFAHYTHFKNTEGDVVDVGLLLFFKGPNSFTGEDVLELQGHGGPVVMDQLLQTVVNLGARMAKPGEFSERAFLNDKLDLAQAEAIADLIDASSARTAQMAVRSLQGAFSSAVHALVESVITLRLYVEAAIDFPEEEIDFISDSHVVRDLGQLIDSVAECLAHAQQGAVMREGITVVIAGQPNVGKSSLLNALSGRDTAIVTDIAGTTRDVLREVIHVEGVPLHIIDTAGLRETACTVEQIGVQRAQKALSEADVAVLVLDSQSVPSEQAVQAAVVDFKQQLEKSAGKALTDSTPLLVVSNKVDLGSQQPGQRDVAGQPVIDLSAKTGAGLPALQQALLSIAGVSVEGGEGVYTARRRHVVALEQALACLKQGAQQLSEHKAAELLAEDLRQAQQALSDITGEFSNEDLLGRIFSSFCIGK